MPDSKPSTSESKPFTYEHYLLFPDDGQRHEIIEGEHYVTPAPKVRHQRLVGRLYTALFHGSEEGRLGEVLLSPTDVLFSNTNIVQPDLLFISNERSEITTEDNIQGAPDLVIEILSPSTRRRDEVLKRDLYANFDVREYWIVDPELETVKIYRRERARFGEPMVVSREKGERVGTALMPELVLELDPLFEGR